MTCSRIEDLQHVGSGVRAPDLDALAPGLADHVPGLLGNVGETARPRRARAPGRAGSPGPGRTLRRRGARLEPRASRSGSVPGALQPLAEPLAVGVGRQQRRAPVRERQRDHAPARRAAPSRIRGNAASISPSVGEERQAARFEPVGPREDVRPRRMMKRGRLRMPFDERHPGGVGKRHEGRAAPVGIARAHDATLPRGVR